MFTASVSPKKIKRSYACIMNSSTRAVTNTLIASCSVKSPNLSLLFALTNNLKLLSKSDWQISSVSSMVTVSQNSSAILISIPPEATAAHPVAFQPARPEVASSRICVFLLIPSTTLNSLRNCSFCQSFWAITCEMSCTSTGLIVKSEMFGICAIFVLF